MDEFFAKIEELLNKLQEFMTKIFSAVEKLAKVGE